MYRPISDYAIIGDMHSAALVSSAGSIDWACLPHFDSPALFLKILDDSKGGYCSVEPGKVLSTTRRYLEGTNILQTTFKAATGVLLCTDFMPIRKRSEPHQYGQDVASDHRIIRLLQCTSGSVDFTLVIKPTFSFALEQSLAVRSGDDSIILQGKNDALHVHSRVRFVQEVVGLTASVTLQAGESIPLVLSYLKPEQRAARIDDAGVETFLKETQAYWGDWSKRCSYNGEHRDAVLRSALMLKLLTFEPTGAIVAAPTTSLPEEIGGVRNWDYRFTWVRDSTFTLMALLNLGYVEEAHDFLQFLRRVHCCTAETFQVLYGIRGERDLGEQTLEHLDGYRGSRPVRVGNDAATQRQLDVYGEVLDCLHLYARVGDLARYHESFHDDIWPLVKDVADHVAQHWRDPDCGIWEVRGGERQFVDSKALCWTALDRALKLAELAGVDQHLAGWRRERDAVHADVLDQGFDARAGAFVQAYGSTALDASVLRMPLLGFIHPTDPRMRSTITQIERQLMRNGLVYRYRDADDGLPGDEGTFAICTFWLIDNYILLGRLQEAQELFRHVLSYANDVGLFAEEIDPENGEQLGNFPQGFTHIALINAAVRLAAAQQNEKPSTHAAVEGASVPARG